MLCIMYYVLCICIYIYIHHVYLSLSIYIYIYIYVSLCLSLSIYVCIYTYIYICIYIYTYSSLVFHGGRRSASRGPGAEGGDAHADRQASSNYLFIQTVFSTFSGKLSGFKVNFGNP